LRADIDYALSEAQTVYGKLGIKVWIFKGEVFGKRDLSPNAGQQSGGPSTGGPRNDRNERGGNDRRDGRNKRPGDANQKRSGGAKRK
jgi:small subunit ribosomal protein S3